MDAAVRAQIKAAADRAEARSRGDDDAQWARTFDQNVEAERRERDLAIIEAEIERLALLPDLTYQIERQAAAERLQLSRSVLDKHVKARRPRKAAKESAPIFDPDKLADSAGHIIQCQKILDLFAKDFSKVIAGEAVNGKLLYLVATSRLFDRPMNAAIKGTSAGGKSEIRKRILAFFPPEDVVGFTSLSERALIYYDGDFSHKILSMGEATAVDEQSFQDYILRELMSEGCIRHSTVQKVGNDLVAMTIEKHGPVAFLVTTTKNKMHPENETRMLSIEIDDSEKQTKSVLDKVAQTAGLHDTEVVDYQRWQDFQRWLASGDRVVVVPYAMEMAKLIPPVAVRLRRDIGQVIAAIQAHALLHRDQRERDEAGRIIADIDHDYDEVRKLTNAIIAESSGVAVNPAMTETIDAVIKATISLDAGEGATAKDIAKLLKLDKSAARRRLLAACNDDYVVNLEVRKGMPGQYCATGQKVEPIVILPLTADLADRVSSSLSQSPSKIGEPCHRDEIAQASQTDNGGKPHLPPLATDTTDGPTGGTGGNRWQTGLAADKSLNGNPESLPVARWQGFSGGYEEEECAVDSAAAIEPSLYDGLDDIPAFLDRRSEASKRCAQCNGRPDGTERHHKIGDCLVLLHDECVKFYRREHVKAGTCP
jgi:hypothetical protein